MQVTFWVASSANIFIFAEICKFLSLISQQYFIDKLEWIFGKVLQLCGGETGGTWWNNSELGPTMQRTNIENSKQIFPEKELRGHNPMQFQHSCVCEQSICLFCYRKYVDRSWEYINRPQTNECGNWN